MPIHHAQFKTNGRGGASCRSSVGSGSTFAVQVPLAEATDSDGKQSVKPVLAKTKEATPKTILIIDDNPIVLESVKLRLEAWNHETLAALSLEEAQELLNGDDVRYGSRLCKNTYCFFNVTRLWVWVICRDGFSGFWGFVPLVRAF